MNIGIDCFECITKQMFITARTVTDEPERQNAMVIRLLKFLAENSKHGSPPDMAAACRREELAITGVEDPLRVTKDLSTELGLKLLPELRKIMETHANPFEAAVRLAIGGNIIDYGADPNFNLNTAEARIKEVFELHLDMEALDLMYKKMSEAKSIFYMLDNCGEAVIDRLLIEQFADKITVGVRGFPILNDVTRREALLSGIDFVPIVDTGDMTPGVSLENTAPAFLEKMRSADLVVTKGQGNYETLSGRYERPIIFLLRVKCHVIARLLDQEMYSLQIRSENIPK